MRRKATTRSLTLLTLLQIEEQIEEINLYKRREQELLNQLQLTEQINMQDLMSSLQQQHKDLLTSQLASLRQAFVTRLPQELLVGSNIIQVAPGTFEVHISDEDSKHIDNEVVAEELFVHGKRVEFEKEIESGVVTSSSGGLVGLVMCVDESGVKQTVSENLAEQNSLVIAEINSGEGVATSEAIVEHSEVSVSHSEMHEVLEESDCEPAKKRLKST